MVLGLIFAGLHIHEWLGLFDEGIKLSSGLFGQAFFSITGLHLLHVITGVVVLAVVARKYSSGSLTPGHVETIGLYWHFVDLVWMFVMHLAHEKRSLFLSLVPAAIFVLLMLNMIWSDSIRLLHMRPFAH